MKKDGHAEFHSANAFCGYAGPEETQHLRELIDQLTDDELKLLVERVGIIFNSPGEELEREQYEMVIDETDREDFYREYREIINSRKTKK